MNDLAHHVPESITLATIKTLQVAVSDEAKAPFVARALHALAHVAEVSSRRSLLDAAGAASDPEALLQALMNPEILAELGEHDPLLAARARGALVQQRLLHAEGGVCSAAQLGLLLGGLSRQAIDKRRKNGKLIALDLGRYGYRYPAWQVHNGTLLTGLERVLATLHESDPWTRLSFMLSPNSWLEGKTPLAELRRGKVDRVVATAEMFTE